MQVKSIHTAFQKIFSFSDRLFALFFFVFFVPAFASCTRAAPFILRRFMPASVSSVFFGAIRLQNQTLCIIILYTELYGFFP